MSEGFSDPSAYIQSVRFEAWSSLYAASVQPHFLAAVICRIYSNCHDVGNTIRSQILFGMLFCQKLSQLVLKFLVIWLFVHNDMGSALYDLKLRAFRQLLYRSVDKLIIQVRILTPADNKRRDGYF